MVKTRILMVEDDLLSVEILRSELGRLGYEVAGVLSTGEEAVARSGELKPHLVLMDIVLGGEMDGIEAAGLIAGRYAVPVIFMTAHDDLPLFNRAKLAEPFGYLVKPVDAVQLHHAIEMALHMHALNERLKESENLYRTIFETTGGATMLVGADALILMVNREFERFSGYARTEVEQRMSWTDFCYGETLDTLLGSRPDRVLPEAVPANYEAIFHDRWGIPRNIYLHLKSIPDTDRSIVSMIDITPRKQLEAAIIRAKREWERTFDTVPDLIMLLDRDFRIVRANRAQAGRLGVTPAELIGKTCCMTIHHSERPADSCPYHLLLRDGQEHFIEAYEPGLQGDFLVSVTPLFDAEGNLTGAVHVAREVTDQKRTEQQLKSSLQEKEVLLKEIHHRVKNNMQVISSLLSLQADYITDDQVRSIFSESRDRVRSMALIHEKLYNSANLARINFSEYTRSLAVGIFRSYNISPQRISLKVDVTEFFFGIDTAIPCGLILNELISNSLKHAFPGDRAGVISIGVGAVPGGVLLTVEDDGVGLPARFDFRTSGSLGLRLVNMLVNQLRGTIERLPSEGTAFGITLRDSCLQI